MGFAGDMTEPAAAPKVAVPAVVAAAPAVEAAESYLKSELNAWVMYSAGPIIVAGEVDLLSNWDADGVGGMHFLGMCNYGVTDSAAVTLRFSGIKMDEADTVSYTHLTLPTNREV